MSGFVPDVELLKRIGGRKRTHTKAFAILRVAKIKTLGNMGASLQHTFRERDTPNADPSLTMSNTVLAGPDNARDVLDAWHSRAPGKIRKNAVHGLEYFIGGSPDKMRDMSRDEQDAYFADALNWLKDRHGAANVLSAVIHRDETTPHMTVMTIPLDDRDKLNARSFVGSRKDLSALQTDFAAEVGLSHGLERGLERSTATHERVQRVYSLIQNPPMAVALPERASGGFLGIGGEREADYRERLSKGLSEALSALVLGYELDARAAQDHITGLTRRLEQVEERVRGLTEDRTTLHAIQTAYGATGRAHELQRTVEDHQSAEQAQAHHREQDAAHTRHLNDVLRQKVERDAHVKERRRIREREEAAHNRRRDRDDDPEL